MYVTREQQEVPESYPALPLRQQRAHTQSTSSENEKQTKRDIQHTGERYISHEKERMKDETDSDGDECAW